MGDIWCMWFSFRDFSYKFPASPGLIYLHLAIIWKDKQILLGEILVSLSLYTVIEPSWGKCAIIGGGRADREDICYTFNTGVFLVCGGPGTNCGMFHLTNFTRLQMDKNSSHPSLVENCFNWQAFVSAQCPLLELTTEFPLSPPPVFTDVLSSTRFYDEAGPRVLAMASPRGWRHPSHSSPAVICPRGRGLLSLSTVLSENKAVTRGREDDARVMDGSMGPGMWCIIMAVTPAGSK